MKVLICTFDSCDKPVKHVGLCGGHYRQHWLGKELTPLLPRNKVQDGQKLCGTCGEIKSVAEFGRKRHYYTEHCRACRGLKIRAETYGLPLDDVREMVARTNCECCGAEFVSVRDRNIDHCHRSGAVRGVLCQKCNTALGCVDDDVDHLRLLIAYIERS